MFAWKMKYSGHYIKNLFKWNVFELFIYFFVGLKVYFTKTANFPSYSVLFGKQ